MNIGFIISYLILPVAMSWFILNSDKMKIMTLQNVLLTKGVCYYILAIVTILNYYLIKKSLENTMIGFTVYIAIVEGSTAIKQANDLRKK